MRCNRGLSTVISSVLIIFVTIVASGVVMTFVSNYANSDFGFENYGLSIETSEGYTYWDEDSMLACVQVSKSSNKELEKIKVVFSIDGNTYFGYFEKEEVPGFNEMRTKCFDLSDYSMPDRVDIFPVYSDTEGGLSSSVTELASGVYSEGILGNVYSSKGDYDLLNLDVCDLYVSSRGDDNNDGSLIYPLRSFEGVRDKILEVKNNGLTKPLDICFRNGVHYLEDTAILDSDFSGMEEYPITFKSYPGEEVIFSGGIELDLDWSVYDSINNIYVADLSDYSDLASNGFRQLYVNDERRQRARTDVSKIVVYEYLRDDNGDKIRWDYGNDRYYARTGRIVVNSSDVSSFSWDSIDLNNPPEMHLKRKFSEHHLRIKDVSEDVNSDDCLYDCNVITFMEPENTSIMNVFYIRAVEDYYHFENKLEFLDEEGEWFLDSTNKKLYYKPKSGENINSLNFISPMIEQVLRLNDVSNIRFVDFSFEHTTWLRPNDFGYMGQGEGFYETKTTKNSYGGGVYQPPFAIKLENSKDIILENVSIMHTGGGAVGIGNDCENINLIGCLVNDTGSNGLVSLDFSEEKRDWTHSTVYMKEVMPTNVLVKNTRIGNVGVDYFGSICFQINWGKNILVENNELFECPYSGIGVFGRYYKFLGENITIRGNYIHDVMTELADGGAIYAVSKLKDVLISENYIHDVLVNSNSSIGSAHAGIYLDDFCEGVAVINNIVIPFENNRCSSTDPICDPAYWGFYGVGCDSDGNCWNTTYSGRHTHINPSNEYIVENAGIQ